jgi:hypothetical protein
MLGLRRSSAAVINSDISAISAPQNPKYLSLGKDILVNIAPAARNATFLLTQIFLLWKTAKIAMSYNRRFD